MKKGLFLIFTLFFVINAFSANLGFKAVGVKGGLVMPEDPWDSGFNIGAVVDMGEITDNLSLVPSVSYWNSGYSYGSFDLGLSNFQVAGDVHYYLKDVPGLYGGGGISLNFLSIEYPSFSYYGYEAETESNSETEFGFGILAGYEMQLGGLKGFVEGKYNLISNLNTIELVLGVYFNMSK